MSGSRGPLPAPAALSGNWVSGAINPQVAAPDMPKELGKEARKEWKRIVPLLIELGLLSKIDRAALAMYCQSYGRLVELEQAFEGMVGFAVNKGLSYADAVYAASQSSTPSGYRQMSVIQQLLNRQREQVNRYLMHFGMSPAARGRVQASNNTQANLPGMEPAQGFARFAVGTENVIQLRH